MKIRQSIEMFKKLLWTDGFDQVTIAGPVRHENTVLGQKLVRIGCVCGSVTSTVLENIGLPGLISITRCFQKSYSSVRCLKQCYA